MKKAAILIVIFGLLFGVQANNIIENVSFLQNLEISSKDTTFKPSGKPIAQVFGNFSLNFNSLRNIYGFNFSRAHFGYEYQFSKQIMARVVLDAGRPTSAGPIFVWDSSGNPMIVNDFSTNGAYYTMFLKFAFIEWAPSKKFKIQIGSVVQNHFMAQEKMWKYRFVAATFQDRYFRTPSGDLGVIAYFKPIEGLGFDFAITNGEGFRSDQDMFGDVKVAAGVDVIINKKFENRLYYDFEKSRNPLVSELQQTVSFYSGYKWNDKFRIGIDVNLRMNQKNNLKQHLLGYSIFSSYQWNPKWSAFVRIDQVTSNREQLTSVGWYYHADGLGFIGGVSYSPIPKVNLAIHYQGFMQKVQNQSNLNALHASFEFLW
jgi:hypothetical protein